MGVQKGIRILEEKEREQEEGRITCLIEVGNERWWIVRVYINGGMERKLENL